MDTVFYRTHAIAIMLFQVLAPAEHHIYDKLGAVSKTLYVALRCHRFGQHSLHIRYVVQ